MKVSFVIPSYNGGAVLATSLPPFMAWLREQPWNYEVFLVDDGSRDTPAVADLAREQGVQALILPHNAGKGAAVRAAVAHITGDYMVYTDNDVPYDYTNISEFLDELRASGADVVVGDRHLTDSRYFADVSPLRRLGSFFFTMLVRNMITPGLRDTQCGLKAFRADAAKRLFARSRINGFAFDVEILFMCEKWGWQVRRRPVRLRSQLGKSVNMLRHGTQMFFDILRVKYFDRVGAYRA